MLKETPTVLRIRDLAAVAFLSLAGLLSGSLLGGRGGATLAVISLAVYSFGLARLVKFNVTHPWVWFVGPLMLYSVSFPILVLAGYGGYSPEVMTSLWLAFSGMVSFSATTVKTRGGVGIPRSQVTRSESLVAGILLVPVGLIALAHNVFLWNSGVTSKYESALLSSPLARLDFTYYLAITLATVIAVAEVSRGRAVPWLVMFILMGVGAAALGVGGERDVLARAGIVVALVWVGAGVLKPSLRLFLLVPVALVLLTIASGWRMGFLVGQSDVQLFGGWSGLTLLMGEELRTASENTVTLLKAVPSTFTYSWGDALGRDLLRGILPGFLLRPGQAPSTSAWFTQTLFPDVFRQGGGVGFTLVGVGYLNFGPAGVAGLFAVLGGLVAVLERFGQKSGMGFVAYVNSVPVLLASIRADMSVPVSQLLKHVFLPVLLVVLLGAVVERVIRARSADVRAAA